ncbi:hypothetical protein [Amycolatopsis jiangsuensis]|uniref:Uncharacterized protein n=1 Tax=Amycolatopsis jiangsuensis TaxID=1181879 RepID=A0A840J0N4_9PSEU|nr:hypothetical protein [Amycolatopsis jiangsuensis]MBB4687299.1 hypothetical protein [Amycolatopsis jiangsuensis]
MRNTPTWQRTRRALTVTALAALVTGGSFLGAGTASAATTLAGQCTGAVSGNMGDSVALPGSSVKEVVRQAAREQVGLFNFLSVWPDALANTIADKGNLAVGEIPDSAGGSIGGDAIGAVVEKNLKGANGLGVLPDTRNKVLAAISDKVSSACGLTTVAANYSAPSSSSPATGGSSTPDQGGQTAPDGSPLGNYQPGSTGTAPRRDYGGIPTATPGTAVAPGARYPNGGALPGSGAVPQTSAGQGPQGQNPEIRNAGNAEALATRGGSEVQLPMLLAVIVLAGVSAGLVRTWVLRRVS